MLDHEQRDAIEALYRSMFDSLYYYALNALEDRSLAEEAVQDTFRIACAKPGELLAGKHAQTCYFQYPAQPLAHGRPLRGCHLRQH